MGANVRCKLPSREEDGYGLTNAIVEQLAEKGYKLIITVDNGITAIPEARRARELGVDLVITDHHLPGEELPDAVAVVDPARKTTKAPARPFPVRAWPSSCVPRWTAASRRCCWISAEIWRPSAPWRT